jgi:hypothetical protein
MNAPYMTDGDKRAEADRIAKEREPAYSEGFIAGMHYAVALLKLSRGVLDHKYEGSIIEVYDMAIDGLEDEIKDVITRGRPMAVSK